MTLILKQDVFIRSLPSGLSEPYTKRDRNSERVTGAYYNRKQGLIYKTGQTYMKIQSFTSYPGTLWDWTSKDLELEGEVATPYYCYLST